MSVSEKLEKTNFTTTTKQILFLKDMGYSDNEIINAISDNWDMSVFKASVMVNYALNERRVQ